MALINTLNILFEDTHIIVCKKPAGVPTQTRSTRVSDMESLIKRHLYRTAAIKKEPYLAVIHRLDQPVSGILVFAKTPAAAKNLNQQLQNKGFTKHYKALLTNQPPMEMIGKPLIHYMVKNPVTNMSSICNASDSHARRACLTYSLILSPEKSDWNLFDHCKIPSAQQEELTMVHIVLDTGRHHQIRLQMSHLGCPIWGDTKYGNDPTQAGTWEQIALCAYALEFQHPVTKKAMAFTL